MISFKSIAIIGLLAARLIYRYSSSVLEPTIWTDIFPLPINYVSNEKLTHSEKLCEGHCTAPESMAISKATGIVYASLNDGTVVSISQEGTLIGPIFFVGGYVASDVKTNGLEGHQEKMTWCTGEARAHRLAWNPDGEKGCGRPLGLRIVDNKVNKLIYFE
jgi:hypothetical protein